jgi:hypothetical protein
MNKTIFIGIIVLLVLFPNAMAKIMLLELEYNGGEFDVKKALVRPGDFQQPSIDSKYALRLFNIRGDPVSAVAEIPFNLPGEIIVEGNPNQGIPSITMPGWSGKFVVIAPYDPQVFSLKLLETKSDGRTIQRASQTLTHIANQCGDGTCQEFENAKSCASDCPVSGSDKHCNNETDGVCDTDCISISPSLEPFLLDSQDCTPPDITSLLCDGSTVCYNGNVFGCFYDASMSKKIWRLATCNEGGAICADGVCVLPFDKIKGYVCRSDNDCVVNGVQWKCECYECHNPLAYLTN